MSSSTKALCKVHGENHVGHIQDMSFCEMCVVDTALVLFPCIGGTMGTVLRNITDYQRLIEIDGEREKRNALCTNAAISLSLNLHLVSTGQVKDNAYPVIDADLFAELEKKMEAE